jgi:hypothetical protein
MYGRSLQLKHFSNIAKVMFGRLYPMLATCFFTIDVLLFHWMIAKIRVGAEERRKGKPKSEVEHESKCNA